MLGEVLGQLRKQRLFVKRKTCEFRIGRSKVRVKESKVRNFVDSANYFKFVSPMTDLFRKIQCGWSRAR